MWEFLGCIYIISDGGAWVAIPPLKLTKTKKIGAIKQNTSLNVYYAKYLPSNILANISQNRIIWGNSAPATTTKSVKQTSLFYFIA